jgi:hypothetical protein
MIRGASRILHRYDVRGYYNPSGANFTTNFTNPTIITELFGDFEAADQSQITSDVIMAATGIFTMPILGLLVVSHTLDAVKRILLTVHLVHSKLLPTHYLVPIVIEQWLNLRRVMLNVTIRAVDRIMRQVLYNPLTQPCRLFRDRIL